MKAQINITRSFSDYFAQDLTPLHPVTPGMDPHEIIHEDFERRHVERAMSMIENPEHWKGEIAALITDIPQDLLGRVMRLIEITVEFYTGTSTELDLDDDGLQVRAQGYWKGPAA